MANILENTKLRKSIEKCFTQNDMTEDGCSDYEDIELFDTKQVVNDLIKLITLRTKRAEKLAINNYRTNILAENYCSELDTYDFDGIAAMVLNEENN
jgi:hypothetical protein